MIGSTKVVGRGSGPSGELRPLNAVRQILVLSTLAATIASCSGFPDVFEAERHGTLQVWNRTEAPIRIIGSDASLEVPACGHESRDEFVLNRFDILDGEGRFIAQFNGGGPESVLLVIRADTDYMSFVVSSPPSDPLPPCEGVIEGQPGTESAPP